MEILNSKPHLAFCSDVKRSRVMQLNIIDIIVLCSLKVIVKSMLQQTENSKKQYREIVNYRDSMDT